MLATLGPASEELLVFPSTVLKADPSQKPVATKDGTSTTFATTNGSLIQQMELSAEGR